jgi:putative oxidoreductase
MAYGLLFLRVVLGLTMAGHGSQKAFGWWHGPGLRGIHGWLASMRFRAVPLQVAALVSAELGGGVALALGIGTPFAALLIAVVMCVAVATTHWRNGFWVGNGGYEFNLLIFAVAVGLAATGPGRFSIDSGASWAGSISGLWWGVGVLGASVLAGLATIELGRPRRRLTTLPA